MTQEQKDDTLHAISVGFLCATIGALIGTILASVFA